MAQGFLLKRGDIIEEETPKNTYGIAIGYMIAARIGASNIKYTDYLRNLEVYQWQEEEQSGGETGD